MTKTPLPQLVAIGGAHIDRRALLDGPYRPGASNPSAMREDIGGGVLNAARSAIQRDVVVTLASVRGGDAAGAAVAEAINAAGITDLSATFLDRITPSYTALLDNSGELIAGFADMALYEAVFSRSLRRKIITTAIRASDGLLVDANPPEDAIKTITALGRGTPLFAIAVSPAKVPRLLPAMTQISCLFMSRTEALTLLGADDNGLSDGELAARFQRLGLKRGVITAGAGAVLAFDKDAVHRLMPPAAHDIRDVTGAGDALAGTATAALLDGRPFVQAVSEGIAAAVCAVESDLSVPDLAGKRYNEVLSMVARIDTL